MTLIVPPRSNKGYGVFHSKIWLIKFDTFIRVVIGTGNQHVNDWIVWLNAYWYQDFSLKGTRICDFENQNTEKI
jgi:tyrosyl-DNA phosphodiesterase-1